MSFSTSALFNDTAAVKLLNIKNPDTDCFSCVGHASSQGRRCRNQIASHNIISARRILSNLLGWTDTDELWTRLYELAGLLLCRRWHQCQMMEVATNWYRILTRVPTVRHDQIREEDERQARQREEDRLRDERRQQEERERADRLREEERQRAERQREEDRQRAERQREEERQRAERQREEERQRAERQRGEARHRAERERQEQERQRAERQRQDESRQQDQQRADHERAQEQERARREQAERDRAEARARREQESRDRAARERASWDESWARYNRDWQKMSRIDTASLRESVKDSVPWPVKSGLWQDVSDRSVEEFFRHAPDGVSECSTKMRSLLRRQALKWHEDKLRQFFPKLADDEECLRLARIVMQTINRMSGR
jgi:hypothetical protein